MSLGVPGVLLLLSGAMASGKAYFSVSASFVPAPQPKGSAAVAVVFAPTDPEVHVNEEPAPRLALDPSQAVLLDKQPPPKRTTPADPARAKYLDAAVPVTFPVALHPKAPKGLHTVRGTVTYFYCSKREGWCRKGTAEVEISVSVP